MFFLLITIQLFSIVLIFIECYAIFTEWKSKVHSYLFFSCVAILVNNIGYLLELTSRTEGEYFTALRFSYFGRIWICFALFLFIAELVKFKLPQIVKIILTVFNVAGYVVVFTTRDTGFYYKKMNFDMSGSIPMFEHTDGPFHEIWTATMATYVVVGLILLVAQRFREKSEIGKKRINMLMFAVFTWSAFALVEMLKVFPTLEKYYDITMIGFPIGTIFMLRAIFKYDLLDAETLAREYIVDELSEGIIVTDIHGEIRFTNKPAIALFPDVYDKPKEVTERIRRAIDKEEPIRLMGRIYTPEANALIDAGAEIGTIYSIADDTEHYKYMEELKEQRGIAERASKAKSTFLANMSHEIRTPINAVLGMDEMILRESKEKEIRAYAADIQTAGRTLLSLVNDILDFSKIEEGRMEILPTNYELSSVVNDLVNMIRDRADKKGLKLKVSVDRHIPHNLYGDEIRIKQIVLNLLTNAVKYTEEGEVGLDVSFRITGENQIGLRFKVTDTGIGMKQEDMSKLFSPFSRIEENRNRTIEGTGLGMSIVKQLLSLMHSRLEVKSVYGEGSEFSFEIKQKVLDWDEMGDYAVRFEQEAGQREEYRELFHAPDAKVLVVDDTEVNLTVIKNLLKRTQIGIDVAASGREGLTLTSRNHYDIAFIDHMMPVMDGIETLKEMKKQGEEGTVYIALTANAVSGAREMYLDAGFNDYLSKPVDGRRLEELIKKYLPAEKVIEASGEEINEDLGASTDSAEIPAFLLDIAEINPDAGIANCGSAEGLISVLEVFKQTATSKADEIEQLYESGDWENYTIKVHALKSSARIIGAAELSELAKELEAAGKDMNLDKIHEENARLLAMYRDLDDKLSPLVKTDENLKDMSEVSLKEAFQTICEIADSMDFGMMEGILKDLKGYKLPAQASEALKQIEDLFMKLDWEGITAIAEKEK